MSFLSFRSFDYRGPSTRGLCDTSPTIVINASNPIVKYPSTSTFFDALSIPGPILRSNALGAVLSANLPVNTSRIEYIGFFPTNLSSYGYCLDTCLPNHILAMNGTNSSTTGNLGPSLFTLLSISVDPKEQHTLTVYNLLDPIAGNTGNITFHSLVATVNDGCGGLPEPLLNDTHRVDSGNSHSSSPTNTSNSSTMSITSFKGQEPTSPLGPAGSSGAQALAQPGATDTQDSKSAISTSVEPASASGSVVGPLILQVNHTDTNPPTGSIQDINSPEPQQSVTDPIPSLSVPTSVPITSAGVSSNVASSTRSLTPSNFVPTISQSGDPGKLPESRVMSKATVGAVTAVLVVSALLGIMAWLVWRRRQGRNRAGRMPGEGDAESIFDETRLLSPSLPPSLSRAKSRRNPGLIASPKPMPRIPLPALPDRNPFADPVSSPVNHGSA